MQMSNKWGINKLWHTIQHIPFQFSYQCEKENKNKTVLYRHQNVLDFKLSLLIMGICARYTC